MPGLLKSIFAIIITTICLFQVHAQESSDQQYWQVVQERASKIISPLQINDTNKFNRVRDLIAGEYVAIKKLDEKKERDLAAVKAKTDQKEKIASRTEKINKKDLKQRGRQNQRYIRSLNKELTASQVETVKDGMTYYVFPKTYQAHLEMIPNLKEEERIYIYDALAEAREYAMAAGSSDAKHAWFGKYKGRINNYLSARGYDLKKEREAWQVRIKSKKQ